MDLTLGLTHNCNLRCTYCYAGRKFKRSMSWQTAKRALDFVLGQTIDVDGERIQLGFFGGEPLLEWDLLRRADDYLREQCVKHGIRQISTVTTNCSLLTADRISWLKLREYLIGLSIDGNADMHHATRRYRNGRNSHNACANALDAVLDARADYEVVVTMDPANVGFLPASIDWLIGMGVVRLALNPNFYTEWAQDKLDLWRKGYEHAAEAYITQLRAGNDLYISAIDSKIKLHIKGGHELCDRCNFGDREIAVAPSGRIYPCERLIGDDANDEMCIGNVMDGGFDEGKRQAILNKRGNINVECLDCAHRDRCMNWCGCINYATTGAINTVHPLICFNEQLSIEVADRVAEILFGELNPVFIRKFYAEPPPEDVRA